MSELNTDTELIEWFEQMPLVSSRCFDDLTASDDVEEYAEVRFLSVCSCWLYFNVDEEVSFDNFFILSDTEAIDGSFSHDEVDDDDVCLQFSFNEAYDDIEDNDNNKDDEDSASEESWRLLCSMGATVGVRGSIVSIMALKLLFEFVLRDFFKGIVKYWVCLEHGTVEVTVL